MAVRTKVKNPEKTIEELRRERVTVAGRRHELEAKLKAAKQTLLDAPERRRDALADEARGRGSEAAAIQAEAEQAAILIRGLEPEIEALVMAERQIGEEVRELVDSDAGVAHYTAAAEALSREAEAARVVAEEAYGTLHNAWRAAEAAWGELRRSAKRRGEDEHAPREVPRPDFQPPIPTMSAHRHPWPGGRRPDARAEAA